jgi:hypothetical protein
MERIGEPSPADRFDAAIAAARAQAGVQAPVIAVLGELNAGKSSVVASFLSETGRRRVPRGVAHAQGTHRFVYWVPSRWLDDPASRSAFLALLRVAHGERLEHLVDDPDAAAQQYRSGRERPELLAIPLVAGDAALDARGAAFVDCPDVQTRDKPSALSPDINPRLDFLARTQRLCSAFLLVWERAKMRDRLLDELLERLRAQMPSSPLLLLINKVRPEQGQPRDTLEDEDLRRLVGRHRVSACHIAYDYDIGPRRDQPGWRELTPPQLLEAPDLDGPFPRFFSPRPDGSAPGEADFLRSLPGRLDPAELQRQAFDDHLAEAERSLREAHNAAARWAEAANARTRDAHAGLLRFCVERFTDSRGEPLQQVLPDFERAVDASFRRTAPWYHRDLFPGLPSWRELAQRASGGLRERLAPLQWIGRAEEAVRRALGAEGVAEAKLDDAASLAKRMRDLRWHDRDEACLTAAWRAVLQRQHRVSIALDPDRLDDMTRAVWQGMTQGQRLRAAFARPMRSLGTAAVFGGLVLATVDGGATLLASYSLAGTLSASIPGALMLGVAAGGAAGRFLANLMDLNTLPALSAFFNLACDAFAVPRSLTHRPISISFGHAPRSAYQLPALDLPPLAPVCPLGDPGLWQTPSQEETPPGSADHD